MTLEANLVFTNVFNFQERRDASLQAFAHSCMPFPFFFIHVIFFTMMHVHLLLTPLSLKHKLLDH
jgi:hypothetical protein